ncbi:MAG: large subunit ribosomal protein [Acidimicrobiaceae bacterium]|jgi:large subunit ribosomal protein L29|nr:large subunit ribosomal protein [Acidimicrobiaceae bacterium]MDQ1444423.1 large subunit ribosomal protein [Acidimicrobiaceae bacterium]
MANVKADELRNMPDDELETRLSEAKQELFNLRFRLVTGQLDNSSRLGVIRKDIARIYTILRDREIVAAEQADADAAAAGNGGAGEEGVTNG